MLRRSPHLVVPLLLASICGLAAPTHAVEVVAGMKIGFTRSNMVGNDLADPEGMNNLTLGGILGWEINDWFAVQLQPMWTQKGAELKNYSVGDLPTTLNLDYLEFPVLAKFKRSIGEDRRGGVFGVVGPALAVKLRANVVVAGAETNVSDNIHEADWGVAFGGGYDIASGPGVTTIDVRYVMGLGDVFNDDAPNPEATDGLKNGSLQITIGWFTGVF